MELIVDLKPEEIGNLTAIAKITNCLIDGYKKRSILVSDIAKKTGVSVQMIRYHLRENLVPQGVVIKDTSVDGGERYFIQPIIADGVAHNAFIIGIEPLFHILADGLILDDVRDVTVTPDEVLLNAFKTLLGYYGLLNDLKQ